MENEEIKKLREEISLLNKQIVDLKSQVNDVSGALKFESDSTTQILLEIIDYLMPVVHKVFPDIAEGKREIASFLKTRPASSSGKKSG